MNFFLGFCFLVLFPLSLLSSRTERSAVKDLGCIHVYATEILRFALNDRKCSGGRQRIMKGIIGVIFVSSSQRTKGEKKLPQPLVS